MIKTDNELCLIILYHEIIRNKRMASALDDLEHLKGLQIVALKMFTPDRDLITRAFYGDGSWLEKAGRQTIKFRQSSPDKKVEYDSIGYGQLIWESLLRYSTEGPVVVLIVSGYDIYARLGEVIGDFNPRNAQPGTMRAKYASDAWHKASADGRITENAIYYSNTSMDALKEIQLFFPEIKINKLRFPNSND